MMAITPDLLVGIPIRAAQRTCRFAAASHGGSIHRQSNDGSILESFVALGAVQHVNERLSRGRGVDPFGEIVERIIAEASLDARLAQTGGSGDGLHGMKRRLAQELPGQYGPHERPSRKTRLGAAIATSGEVALQFQPPHRIQLQAAERRTVHVRLVLCFRAKISNSALAVSTSRTAS